MSHTQRESSMIMHSQDRNRHGKIFGGFLMRQAFDMSFLTAALFQRSKNRPELIRVDQVLFLKPVEVGSMQTFKSKVTFCKQVDQGILMRVVTQSFNENGEQAGNFNFVFLTKKSLEEEMMHFIKPQTYHEILDYHEATRRLKFEPIGL